MHPIVYAEFRRILKANAPQGPVLEVGAAPPHAMLLDAPELDGVVKIGVDLDAHKHEPPIIQANAHQLPFKTAAFGTVLCNSVLEHDPQFWLTCAEMRRVLRTGGLLAIGVPGFVGEGTPMVLGEHNYPNDYYRFGQQAVGLFFGPEMRPQLSVVMHPPRIIGWAIKR